MKFALDPFRQTVDPHREEGPEVELAVTGLPRRAGMSLEKSSVVVVRSSAVGDDSTDQQLELVYVEDRGFEDLASAVPLPFID
jgi:hypothetical protein